MASAHLAGINLPMLAPVGDEHGFSSADLPLYYEWHGKSSGTPPLLLIHGGGSTIESNWTQLIRALESSRRMLAVELQGHGRTGPGEQERRSKVRQTVLPRCWSRSP